MRRVRFRGRHVQRSSKVGAHAPHRTPPTAKALRDSDAMRIPSRHEEVCLGEMGPRATSDAAAATGQVRRMRLRRCV